MWLSIGCMVSTAPAGGTFASNSRDDSCQGGIELGSRTSREEFS
jgi:hypothetical protein